VRRDGRDWIAARRYEWWERCRLSPRQADRAGRILEKLGLLVRALYKFSAEPTVHYSLNLDEFIAAWEDTLNFPSENPFLPNCKNDFTEGSNLPNGERFLRNGEIQLPEMGNGFYENGEMELPETGKSLTETTDRDYFAETTGSDYFSENSGEKDDTDTETADAEKTTTTSSSSLQPTPVVEEVQPSRKYVPPPPGTRERVKAAIARSQAKLKAEKDGRWEREDSDEKALPSQQEGRANSLYFTSVAS
jgi:hypothetical protein